MGGLPEEVSKKKCTVEIEIPEVDKDGSCDCPLHVYVGHNCFECVIDSAEMVEHDCYDELYPGKECPRYEESQEKRK